MHGVLDRLASRRGLLRGAGLGVLVFAASCAAAEPVQAIVVHRDPGCGCCHAWVAHMQQAAVVDGFALDAMLGEIALGPGNVAGTAHGCRFQR